MLNVIRGKVKIREKQILKLLDIWDIFLLLRGMGHFYVLIWMKKHLQKYDQE